VIEILDLVKLCDNGGMVFPNNFSIDSYMQCRI